MKLRRHGRKTGGFGGYAREPFRRVKGAMSMSIPEIVHWVDGKPWDGTSRRFANVTNPATGAVTI